MTSPFLSPDEFLNAVRAAEELPYDGQMPDPEMMQIHQDQVKAVGVEGVNPAKFFDDLFAAQLKMIAGVLPSGVRSEVLQRVAVGTLDHALVNAQITRSADGSFFAILINRALIVLANHYMKLVAAARHPGSVLYCERIPTAELLTADFAGMGTAMLKEYAQTGNPKGPQLKLGMTSEAMKELNTTIGVFHLFVLAHEIGHFVNGDLAALTNFNKCHWDGTTLVFAHNVSHAMEYKADEFAFETVLKVLAAQVPHMRALQAFYLSALPTFNFLRDISNRGCESHPKPSDRILNLTGKFFGADAAVLMAKSFSEVAAINAFREQYGKLTATEMLRSLR